MKGQKMDIHEHRGSACEELLTQLSDYIDGELEESLCTELEAHLAQCQDCRLMVDTMRKTITLYRDHSQVGLPETVRQRLYTILKLKD